MNSNGKIKIIKKNEIIIAKPLVVTAKKLKETATREQALTVSNWVNEFQTRRCQETQQAFDLFSSQIFQPA
jgi:hypothetical protein